AWSGDGRTLASASEDGTIKLWDLATGHERATLKGHNGHVMAEARNRDGTTLASGGGGLDAQGKSVPGEVKLWDAATGQERASLKGDHRLVWSVAWSVDGKTLASAASAGIDGTIKLWDLATGQERAFLKGPT